MDYQLRRALAIRGAVYNIFRVDFPGITKPKYCVLMENCSEGKPTALVIFTTHRTEFSYQKSSVFVRDGDIEGISGDTLIQCQNFRELDVPILFDERKSRYLCRLDSRIIQSVNEALTFVRNIDESILIRMSE